jgi:hypothetical protein
MLCSQQIIEAIKTRLLSGTDADARVYADRLWPLDEGELPAIRLYELREQVTPETIHFPVLEKHELEVGIELCAASAAGIDAVLAALKLQVLQCLFDTQPHSTLGFTNVRCAHTGTGPMQPIETATSQLAQRTLQVTARFSAFAHQPETFV